MIDRILVADDEYLVRQFLEESVRRCGIEVVPAADGREAIEVLRDGDVQLAFVDLKMDDVSGLDVLRFRNEHCPEVMLVIMTAYGSLETAVEAIRLGAFDFLLKPFSPDQAAVVVEKARRWLQMDERRGYLQQEVRDGGRARIIGESGPMQKVLKLIERVAPTRATVLVTGESGTGKELVASEIHRLSDPANERPYIRMNCAAVPEALLESELFGHEKGAFTGAVGRRVGRFELADGGTLLLDEIGEISAAMQAKLLRVLQESEFERVGGSKTIEVDVRVVATTNRDLQAEVKAGNFREDLFYRLNVFPIRLPALRERADDVVRIAEALLEEQERRLGRRLRFTDRALTALGRYPWPGNVRELQNVVERVAILEDGPEIDSGALPLDTTAGASAATGTPVQALLGSDAEPLLNIHELERLAIQQALEKTDGNRTRAADLLGVSVRTLRNKLNDPRSAFS